MMLILLLAKMSIHERIGPLVSVRTPSLLTWPLCVPVASMVTVLPQISTQAVYRPGCAAGGEGGPKVGCAVVSALQWFGGFTGKACPPASTAIDCTMPKMSTSQPSRWTRSAPGSLPSLLTLPVSPTVSLQPEISVSVPPPGG